MATPPCCSSIMTAIVYYKHRANISRLMAGTEARIGAKRMSKRAAGAGRASATASASIGFA